MPPNEREKSIVQAPGRQDAIHVVGPSVGIQWLIKKCCASLAQDSVEGSCSRFDESLNRDRSVGKLEPGQRVVGNQSGVAMLGIAGKSPN